MSPKTRRFFIILAVVAVGMIAVYYGTPLVVSQEPDLAESKLRERAIDICRDYYAEPELGSGSNGLDSPSKFELKYERDGFRATVTATSIQSEDQNFFIRRDCQLQWDAGRWKRIEMGISE